MSYLVEFYSTPRGEKPVEEFIKSQDKATISKYSRLAVLLAEYGPFLNMPYSRKLSNNLYELRSKGDTKIRIIYTYFNQKYILLHAFKKKTKKTPAKEINLAQKRQLTLI
jgi:phage-related protein